MNLTIFNDIPTTLSSEYVLRSQCLEFHDILLNKIHLQTWIIYGLCALITAYIIYDIYTQKKKQNI